MRVLLVFALAACSSAGHVSRGPAWPKAAVHEVDGGESLAPRAAARAIAVRSEDDRAAERSAGDKPVVPAVPGAAGDRSTATPSSAMPSSATPPEEIPGEEIVIEIDD